jgi:serine/threonine protein kinase
VQRLEVLHEAGFTHNDLKFDNILVGFKDPTLIYLIDFGLAARLYNMDGSHVEKQSLGKFSGNFMFASLGACRCMTKGRRDDV